MREEKTFAAWIGLDWADRQHVVCIREAGTDQVEIRTLEHKPAAIRQWLTELRQRYGGRPVAVALEQSRGALMYALMGSDFLVLYPINPRALSSYRKAFRLSGAKDDPGDGQLLLDFLYTHHSQLKAWWPEAASTRALRLLTEHRHKLVQERTRLVNRLISHLKEYFPQVLQWFEDRSHRHCLQFVQRWPSLQQLQRARSMTLRRQFEKWRWSTRRRQQTLEQIGQAVALTEDEAVLAVYPQTVQILAEQLLLLQNGIDSLQQDIQQRFQSEEDAPLFASFPGAGEVHAPRLLVAFGTDRCKFDDTSMSCWSGIAPVTEKSGSYCWIHHRIVCSTFLKQTFHEYAWSSLPHSPWANAYYHLQRQRGKSHHKAIRALAFKWIRILTRCWKGSTPYSEEKYLEALRRSNSPLIAFMEKQVA